MLSEVIQWLARVLWLVCVQLCKKLIMLGCCFACLAILLLMIPDVLGGIVTDWVTNG